ncbi:hypothetical protein FQR65_LT17981 [Abscondita terminalis]|nr:hypothetical protein FQR65_LT17981 [Abscondita terminalis]
MKTYRQMRMSGGSGFVGTSLIELLSPLAQYELVNIDKNPSEQFPEITRIVNVMDKEILCSQLKGVDVVVLLAAEHRDDIYSGFFSVAIYGLDKDNPDESFPAEPFNHYGKSKWQAEQVLQEWYKNHQNWNINIIRPTVIFGEGNRGNVYNLLNQIAKGRFMMIDKQKKIFITGHQGMVGSRVLKCFKEQGFENILTASSKELDLRNQSAVEVFFQQNKPSYVIHLAAKVGGIKANIDNPGSFLYDNLMIQSNVVPVSIQENCPTAMKEEYLLTGSERLSMDQRMRNFEMKFSAFQGCSDAILFNSGGSANCNAAALKNLGRLKDVSKIGFSATYMVYK